MQCCGAEIILRIRSRNHVLNKYLLYSLVSLEAAKMKRKKIPTSTKTDSFYYYCYSTFLSGNIGLEMELKPEPK